MTTTARGSRKRLECLRLAAAVDGRIITPGNAGYDEARVVFYGGFDRRPAVIVRPSDAGDVAQVVSVARESGLELAVLGGGHSLAWRPGSATAPRSGSAGSPLAAASGTWSESTASPSKACSPPRW